MENHPLLKTASGIAILALLIALIVWFFGDKD